MVQIIADNIISGLGNTTASNLEALRNSRSALGWSGSFRVPDANGAVVSLVEDASAANAFVGYASLDNKGFTRLEKFMVCSVAAACKGMETVLEDKSTVFVFSTTKGNIKYLGRNEEKVLLGNSAAKVAGYFCNPNNPVVLSNACISGVAAAIVAKRFLEAGLYKTAVVVGADEVTEFVVSGFGSFKALSDEPCRPFDASRKGLNLGEAVGTLVLAAVSEEDGYAALGRKSRSLVTPQFITGGAVTNDANHISGPSRTAEGLYRAIAKALGFPYGAKAEVDALEAFVNPHGTATLYNDQMESLAISRSGLSALAVSPLKGYYGHTLGASGVIETILSCHFMDEGWLPAACGYSSPGCHPAPDISPGRRRTEARWFLKTVSGFGGCNAAIKVEKYRQGMDLGTPIAKSALEDFEVADIFEIDYKGDVKDYLASLYRQTGIDYPKFHKMDLMCKAGIIAAHKLLDITGGDSTTAIVFYNSRSSYAADTEYLETIGNEEFFPSPAVFVYTLPSIVTGEIAIRHKLYGETAFFVGGDYVRAQALNYIACLLNTGAASRALLCYDESLPGKCSLKAELIIGKRK